MALERIVDSLELPRDWHWRNLHAGCEEAGVAKACSSLPGALSETVSASDGGGEGMRPISRTNRICRPIYGFFASVDQTRAANLPPVFKARRTRTRAWCRSGTNISPKRQMAASKVPVGVELERRRVGDLGRDVVEAGLADRLGGGGEHAGRDVGGQHGPVRANALRGQDGLIARAGRHIEDPDPGCKTASNIARHRRRRHLRPVRQASAAPPRHVRAGSSRHNVRVP